MAYDNGSPARSSTVMAYISVLRNFVTPKFSREEYKVNILESQTAGIPFFTVTAEDSDRIVNTCEQSSFTISIFSLMLTIRTVELKCT